ncbi:MAG: iron-binding protein [Rhodobacteraceae bacterium]|nr:CDGSH iron-sulfur domain-containing protein [Alphaproteobacteria bacterium]MBT8476955.1 CDGSH iron-sulfur domain-containing protein [Alphaproteobacteria bacterium]NNF72368.1 iron-binding protein [Paracoccaceae bacterium]NNK68491.1 iron-binding protein [Paracoccaceae bacterium]
MAKPRSYAGKDIEISFDMGRCIHARNCFLKLPQVFDPERRPWVDPDAAPVEEITAMIRTCPSGALTFRRLDGGLDEAPAPQNRAAVLENGPLALAGELRVDGEPMVRATLCRCGRSANKPYCDYAHVKAGFVATGEPAPQEKEAPPEVPGGTLEVIPHENGPLEARGPLEVTSGTGARLHRGSRAFLCRCGQSANKPFCDGSHKRVGFEAPGPRDS